MNHYECSKCQMEYSRPHGVEGHCPKCGDKGVEIFPLTPAQMEDKIDKLRTEMLFDDGWDTCLIGEQGQSHIQKALAYLELAKIECRLAVVVQFDKS